MPDPVELPQDDITSRRSELEALLSAVLDQARGAGATAAEAVISTAAGLDVSVRMGEVETLEHQRDRSLGVTVYFGRRTGSASTSDLSEGAVRETVQAACGIARYTAEDPCAGLADPALMPQRLPELDLYHPWALEADAAIERALACEQAARDYDPRIHNSEGAGVGTQRALRVYGNSHGFMGVQASTVHSTSCAVIGTSGETMQRDYWFTVARDSADLENNETVGREAGRRTVARLGARRLATCQAPVLFAPQTARGLIGHLVGAVSGGNLYRGASYLLDRLGEKVCSSIVRLHEQPHLPKALASAAFDAEGVATAPRDLVTEGELQGYVLDSYAGCRLGRATTGNAGGVHNLTVEPGDEDFDALVRRMDRGLIVTELMGQGVNLVTGDYSRGAAGFWVDGGEIQYPVEEITIAGNLDAIFRGVVAVGSDLDVRGSIRAPSLLVDEMTIAGE